MRTRMKSGSVAAAVALILSLNVSAANAQASAHIELPAQPLSEAIRAVARQASVNILVDPRLVEGRQAPAIKSRSSVADALSMLLEGTGLTPKFVDDKTITLVEKAQAEVIPPRAETATPTAGAERVRVVQAESIAGYGENGGSADHVVHGDKRDVASNMSVDSAGRRVELEEVLVTGSHIRGVENLSSPLITFDREDIEKGGFGTTQQLIQSLPQNVGNISDTTLGSVNGGPRGERNYGGSGVNLRGLGSDSSLVLLNGRRLASAGQGSFVDLSLIPISAIERVEVLTDGASAIYGSDAVGGVVNLVLREDFNGAETRARFGAVTQGNLSESQASQLFGYAWNSGRAIFGYEYFEKTKLDADDRDFIKLSGRFSQLDVVPEQKRHGAVALITQQLSDRLELDIDSFYGYRKSAQSYEDFGVLYNIANDVEQYSVSLGLSADVGREWQARLAGMVDGSESKQSSIGAIANEARDESRLWSIDVAADGPVARMPGGEANVAIGAQMRRERFEGVATLNSNLQRRVSAAYAEMLVPFVGESNRRPGIEHMQLSMAARYEDYSDFGGSLNPKFGMSWSPVSDLVLRTNWGTSFRAPLLTQINPADSWVTVYENLFADTSSSATAIMLTGSGVNLKPEESTNWTLGFDYSPPQLENLEVSATYFNVTYEQRIRTPLSTPGYSPLGILLDPIYESLVKRAPELSSIRSLLEHPFAICLNMQGICSMPPPDQIDAIVDMRLQNLASVRVDGIDFAARYEWLEGVGAWSVRVDGTYLLSNREQFISGAREEDLLNDVWRPVDFRIRGGISYGRSCVNVTAIVNYTDGYRDVRAPLIAGPGQRESVGSWTTVDATIAFDLGKRMSGTKLTFSAINLFDREPPFTASAEGLHFDGVNANPLGRFVSAQLTKQW